MVWFLLTGIVPFRPIASVFVPEVMAGLKRICLTVGVVFGVQRILWRLFSIGAAMARSSWS